MRWDDLSNNTKSWMQLLGNFTPTVNVKDRMVKGYTIDPDDGSAGKTYHTSDELRELAEACNEVADWLDNRAAEANGDA
jgi:hypothetical protein